MEASALVAWLQIMGIVAAIVLVLRLWVRWPRVCAFWAPRWERTRRRIRPEPPRPAGRPIEAIARDARRIGGRFHRPVDRMPFAKVEGIRRAYDDVLAEACDALGIDHLLRILPPGTERDLERGRVEWMLSQSGFGLSDAA